MQTKQQSIENFKKAIDELISCRYILYEKKLSDLLRTIGSSKIFCALLQYVTEDFDYDECFEEFFVRDEAYAGGHFVLPSDAGTVIALVSTLLYRIATNEVDFYKLLEQYFYVNDFSESYRRFAIEILVPFRAEVLRAVEAMAEESYADVAATEPAPVAEVKAIPAEILDRITQLLNDSYSLILQYKLEDEQKAEFVTLYDNFKTAVYNGDTEKMKPAYLGYKYASLYYRKKNLNIQRIGDILKQNGIL